MKSNFPKLVRRFTITIHCAVSARLLAVALDLLPPAFVAGPGHSSSFLRRILYVGLFQIRCCGLAALHLNILTLGCVNIIVQVLRIRRRCRIVLNILGRCGANRACLRGHGVLCSEDRSLRDRGHASVCMNDWGSGRPLLHRSMSQNAVPTAAAIVPRVNGR